jgi:dienelactone hydrolase
MFSIFLVSSFLSQAEVPGAKPLASADGNTRSVEMVAGIDKFLMRKTEEIGVERRKRWEAMVAKPGFPDAETMREKLRTSLGIKRSSFVPDFTAMRPLRKLPITETETFTAEQVAWAMPNGRRAEALLLRPKNTSTLECSVAIPDASQSPQMICGLEAGLPPQSQFARFLVEAGLTTLIPSLANNEDDYSGHEALGLDANQPHREWVYRQAFELGRHPIGLDVEVVLACASWFRTSNGPKPIYLVGHGEGGLLALYAAALKPSIRGAYVSGVFQDRSGLWSQPIWRNVFGILKDFDDAEVAALIFPRLLFVDHVSLEAPNFGAWRAVAGRTPGLIKTPTEESFIRASKQASKYAAAMNSNEKTVFASFSTTADDPNARPENQPLCLGLERFAETIGIKIDRRRTPPRTYDREELQQRVVGDLTEAVQREYRASERVRKELWKDVDPKKIPADKWHSACASLREKFRKEVIGEFEDAKSPPNPRARKLKETPNWVMHEVVLDVWPEVFAWGYLLLPKDLKPGENRPVVVCQHGLEGLPEDCVTDDPKSQGFQYYQAFAAKLADRGFITFVPHNPYRGGDKFRVLQRKANPLGRSLFSIIVAQHEVITDWLAGLPFVDPARIGFYGLSYGGKTAMRVPALVDRYCLSICSADFNDWIRKNVVADDPHSYMFTGEYEMPEWNLGRTFNYAEMAALIAPRPFMVERGHYDGVAPDEWVAYEYAKVRRLYAELKIPERTEIEWFLGPHRINGVGTFDFLHKHLKWPKK